MKIDNPNPIQWQFSERAQQLQSSFIREILKITQRPEIISFAGGLPSPATFPVERMKEAYDKVLSLVNSTPDFTEQHLVTNGASELLGEVFGDAGKHARSAFGVAQLPRGTCVEIEMIVEVA